MNRILQIAMIFLAVVLYTSCQNNSHPGYEYMPDMYRSPGIETYAESNIKGYHGVPVKGTLSRGNLTTFPYDHSDSSYLIAGEQATYPDSIYTADLMGNIQVHAFTKDSNMLEEGKVLYGMFCQHCHGANGMGGGTINHPAYSAVPYYNDDELERRPGVPMSELKEGHVFHAITYGLNAMGPHASQITEEERWKIVYYVQEELQTKKPKE